MGRKEGMDGWREKSGRAVVSERLVEDGEGIELDYWKGEKMGEK